MTKTAKIEIFDYSDIKTYLTHWIESQADSWGLVTKLAEAAKCQRPYLSRVLKGGATLSTSQGYGIAAYCGLTVEGTEFLLNLLEIERATSSQYRSYLESRNRQLKSRHEDLALRTQRPSIEVGADTTRYYSAWYWSAIHILSSIPEYQTEEQIAARLYLPSRLVRQILEALEQTSHVRRQGKRWVFAGLEAHLSRHSPLIFSHHNNWRQQALRDAQETNSDSMHFTVVQSISRRDFQRLRQMVANFIEEFSGVTNPSPPEDLVCFNCDLFVP